MTGHFPDGPGKRPWVSIDELVTGESARIVGALEDEVRDRVCPAFHSLECERLQNSHVRCPALTGRCDEHADGQLASAYGIYIHMTAVENGVGSVGCFLNPPFFKVPFYQPTAERFKILVEAKAFPSDHFAVLSQIRQRGYDL